MVNQIEVMSDKKIVKMKIFQKILLKEGTLLSNKEGISEGCNK